MAKRIDKKDLFEQGLFDDVSRGAKSLSEQFQQMKDSIAAAAKETKELVKGIKTFDANSINQLDAAYTKVKKSVQDNNKVTKEKNKLDKEAEKLQEKLEQLKEDQLKQNLKLRKSIQNETKATKDLLEIERELGKEYEDVNDAISDLNNVQIKQVNTIKEAQEQNKALRIIVRNLNAEIPEQADQIERLNSVIDRNTSLQKGNSDQFVQDKINAGNYTDSIKEAIQGTGLFGQELGQLQAIIGPLAGLFSKSADEADNLSENTDNAGKSADGAGRRFRNLNNILKASIIGAVVAAVAALGAAFTSGRAGAIRFQKASQAVSIALKSLVSFLAQVGAGLITFFQGLGPEILKIGKLILSALLAPTTVLLNILDGLNQALQKLGVSTGNVGEGLSNMRKQLNEFTVDGIKGISTIGDGFDKISEGAGQIADAFRQIPELIDSTKKAIETGLSAIDKQFDFQDRIQILRLGIADLNGEISILEQITGDSTKSLNERIEASNKAIELQEKLIQKQQEQARLELELQQAAIAVELERNKVFFNANPKRRAAFEELLALSGKQNKSNEDLIAFTEKFAKLQLDINEIAENSQLPEQYEELTAATENLIGVSAEGQAQLQALQQARLENERDLFEQNLDFIIDIGDANKTLLEQQVQDTRLSVEDRKKIFQSLVSSYKNTVEQEQNELQELAKRNAEILGTEFRDIDFTFGEEGIEFFVDGIKQSTDNAKELADVLQTVGFDEVTIKRVLEIVKEAKVAKKDFNDLNRELDETSILIKEISSETLITDEEIEKARQFNEDFQEFLKSNTKLSGLSSKELQNILDQQQEFNDRREKEEQEFQLRQLELQAKNIQDRINLAKEGSQDRIELEKELADVQLQINQRLQENITDNVLKELEKRKEAEEKFREATIQAAELAENISKRISEGRIDRINEEISALEKRESRLQELADQGNQLAAKSLQEDQKRRAELEREARREQEAQARRELLIAAIRAVAENPDASIAEILGKLAILPQAVEAIPLPGFFTGTENVEESLKGKKMFKGRDEYLAQTKAGQFLRIDGKERIMTGEQNSLMQGVDNDTAANVVNMWKRGLLFDSSKIFAPSKQDIKYNRENVALLSRVDKMTKEITDLKNHMPDIHLDYDSIAKSIVKKVETKFNKKTFIKKDNGIY